jgi:hypothetical protein
MQPVAQNFCAKIALYLIAQSVIPEHLEAFNMEENVSAHKLRNIPRGNCAQERRILQTFLRRKVLLPFRVYRTKRMYLADRAGIGWSMDVFSVKPWTILLWSGTINWKNA